VMLLSSMGDAPVRAPHLPTRALGESCAAC
jgi:hypothetical protein